MRLVTVFSVLCDPCSELRGEAPLMGLTHPHQLYHRHISEAAAENQFLDIGVCAVLVELIHLVIFSQLIHDLLA